VELAGQADAQERRVKARISNAGFTITALPLLAAKDWAFLPPTGWTWRLFSCSPRWCPRPDPGRYRLQRVVGPASVNATLAGFQTRAIWFSSDKISYWLMAKPHSKLSKV